MNRLSKFFISFIFVIAFVFTCTSSFSFADWSESFYEKKEEENIGSGIKHEHILRFTDKGWINVNVIKSEINNQYVSVDLLWNHEGLNTRKPLSTLVDQEDNIIAAINGDFFNTAGAASLGPMVKNGELLTTPFYIPSQMAAFNINENNKPFIDYWTIPIITITNEKNKRFSIAAINKETETNNISIIYTPKWGSYTPPLAQNLNTGVEMVVINEKVVSIHSAKNGTPIPSDGFVILATGNHGQQILDSFNVGDKILYDTETDMDFESFKIALGGGAMLVNDGEIIDSFSHTISGNHPRTALGISKDEKEILLVTVDGRTASFSGVTQKELAQIMVDLGAYTAINLDGGGSTEMLLRPLGKDVLAVGNHLSDGKERNITNGIGIISTAPSTSIKGLKLNTQDNRVFVNTPRKITIEAYDRNYNPVETNNSRVKWHIDGVSGDIDEGIFTPHSTGKATITATYKNVKETIELDILGQPTSITLDQNQINIPASSQTQLTVTGTDNQGYSALIDPALIHFSVSNNIGNVNHSGIFQSANTVGTGILSASLDELTAYVPIAIGTNKKIIDTFEKNNGSFLSYPAIVPGHYSIAPFPKEGKFSGQISYDFTTTDATRAAYLVFNNKGIKIDRIPQSLGLWVYGNEGNGHGLKVKITDSKGISKNISLTNNINWSGYKYIETTLPSTLTAPIYIERIYVVEINPVMKDTGKIYIDNLTLANPVNFTGDLPAPITKTVDPAQQNASLQSEDAFNFIAHGSITEIDTLRDRLVASKMSKIFNKAALNIFTGTLDSNLSKELENPQILSLTGYSYTEYNNCGFFALDNNMNSLRLSNSSQWSWFFNTLQNIDVKNVIITLPKSLSFNDPLEETLFKDTLQDLEEMGIDVWVLYGDEESYQVHMENGIHYVALKAYPLDNQYDIFSQLSTMVFTVNNDKITYQIVPLYAR